MKAKEYFEKYKDLLISEDKDVFVKAMTDMTMEMSCEVKEIAKIRNVKTDSGLISVMKEINQKYNAVVTLFIEKNGSSPIIRDGMVKLWVNAIPQLKEYNLVH